MKTRALIRSQQCALQALTDIELTRDLRAKKMAAIAIPNSSFRSPPIVQYTFDDARGSKTNNHGNDAVSDFSRQRNTSRRQLHQMANIQGVEGDSMADSRIRELHLSGCSRGPEMLESAPEAAKKRVQASLHVTKQVSDYGATTNIVSTDCFKPVTTSAPYSLK